MNYISKISIDFKSIFVILMIFFACYLINLAIFKFYNKLNYSFVKKYINYSSLLCSLISILLFFKYNITYYFFIYFILSFILISVSFIDFKYMEIPDETNAVILFLGLIQIIINHNNPLEYFLGFLIAGGIFLLIAIITNGSIGGGDIKLIACIGLVLGIDAALIITFYSSILSIIGLVYALIIKKQSINSFIPYGPFITLSTFYFLLM